MIMSRPLIIVTNSNPELVNIEKRFQYVRDENLQSVDITLTPTGTKMGVASLVVRTIVTSLQCDSPSSMTFIVQVHRAAGRRLYINYP
jgi:hypothetical protein